MLLPLEISHRTVGITIVFDFVQFSLIWALFLPSLRSVLPVSIIILALVLMCNNSANNYSSLICLILAGSVSLRFSVCPPKQYLTVSEPWEWKTWLSFHSYSFSHLDLKKKIYFHFHFSFQNITVTLTKWKFQGNSHALRWDGNSFLWGTRCRSPIGNKDCRKPLVITLQGEGKIEMMYLLWSSLRHVLLMHASWFMLQQLLKWFSDSLFQFFSISHLERRCCLQWNLLQYLHHCPTSKGAAVLKEMLLPCYPEST